MSKILAIVIGVIAASVALSLLLMGRRRLHVDEGARGTLRGRFLVAVAFFLALFGGAVDRAKGAEKRPPAAAAKQLSLARMKATVQKIFRNGPVGSDWMDPHLSPSLARALKKAGLLANPNAGVTCYKRAGLPVEARSEEMAALQKALLDEKIAAGVIPEEVGGKITAIPDPKPGTPKEARAYQKKVRRAARLLYKAGELDSATIKKLEAAIGIPIVKLDPEKALKADITYSLQGRVPWRWRAASHKEYLAMLAKQGVINTIKTRRGEMATRGQPDPKRAMAARAKINKIAALLANPKHTPTLAQDKGKTVTVPFRQQLLLQENLSDKEPADRRLFKRKWQTRRAIRILISNGILDERYAKHFSKPLGVSMFGTTKIEAPPRLRGTCYLRAIRTELGPGVPPAQRREIRRSLGNAGALSDDALAKLDRADEQREN